MTRVLVVEDTPVNIRLFQRLLTGAGYEVCEDAATALRSVKKWQPDLILMDIQLPDLDGLNLTRQLKSSPLTAAIPIVALTAFAMKSDEQKALGAGCVGYMTKPVDTRTFIDTISQACGA